MDEFASRIEKQAAEALRQVFGQEATPEMSPIIELIGLALADEAGSCIPASATSITTEQWVTWNQLAMDRPQILTQTPSKILEREQSNLPAEMAMLRSWAAWLVVSTLDRMGML